MDVIYLDSMVFKAYHGVYDFEATNGGDFRVDLELHLDLSQAAASDKLEDTVDYEAVYHLVSREMQIRAALIENVAYRIKEVVLRTFPEIQEVVVKLSKLEPPIDGKISSTAVMVKGSRT